MSRLARNLEMSANRGDSGITPADISSVFTWISFSDEQETYTDLGSTLVSGDGDRIKQCNDRVSSNNIIQNFNDTYRPYNTRSIVNGKTVGRFTSPTYMYYDNTVVNAEFTGADEKWTVVASVANWNTSNNVYIFALYSSTTGARSCMGRIVGTEINSVAYGALNGSSYRSVTSSGAGLDGSPVVITINYNGSIDTNNGIDRFTFRVNGVEQSKTMTTSGSLLDIPDNTFIPIGIGDAVTGSNAPEGFGTSVDFGQSIFLKDATNEDIEAIETYLMNDWGL